MRMLASNRRRLTPSIIMGVQLLRVAVQQQSVNILVFNAQTRQRIFTTPLELLQEARCAVCWQFEVGPTQRREQRTDVCNGTGLPFNATLSNCPLTNLQKPAPPKPEAKPKKAIVKVNYTHTELSNDWDFTAGLAACWLVGWSSWWLQASEGSPVQIQENTPNTDTVFYTFSPCFYAEGGRRQGGESKESRHQGEKGGRPSSERRDQDQWGTRRRSRRGNGQLGEKQEMTIILPFFM